MQGADKYYNLITKAYNYNIKGLNKIDCGGYGEGYKENNIVFILSEHARGKTFNIWVYETSDIQDALNDEHLEVYGVTSGNLGWTEAYGWLVNGSWKNIIEGYFSYLEQEIHNIEESNQIQANKQKEKDKKEYCEKVNKFNKIFK